MTPQFEAYRGVILREPLSFRGITLPAGSRGTVVEVYETGDYGVEFPEPIEAVHTIHASLFAEAP